MAALTCNASLKVEACDVFPMTFPFTFGPRADITQKVSAGGTVYTGNSAMAAVATPTATCSRHQNIGAALSVAAGRPASAGKRWTADANLSVTTYRGFPYVFPFVFEASFVDAHVDHPFAALAPILAAMSAATLRNAGVGGSLPVTVGLAASVVGGGIRPAFVALPVTASPTAAMLLNHRTDAALPVSSVATVKMALHALANAPLAATAVAAGRLSWATRLDAALPATAALSSKLSLHSKMSAALAATAAQASTATLNHMASARLTVTANRTIMANHSLLANAQLTVVALRTVTTPQSAGFWPYYL